MADPMKIRASAKEGITEVKILMSHEMETGQRKDAAGALIPAHFITEVSAEHNGKQVLAAMHLRKSIPPPECHSHPPSKAGTGA